MGDALNLTVGLIVFGISCAMAAPYLPPDDRQVLEILPGPVAERSEIRKIRAVLKTDPGRVDLALALAERYIRLGRTESDPRHFAHAEAVLKPWLDSPNPAPEALLLRATVLQNRHEFNAALADVGLALRHNPRRVQAWLTLAAIHEAQGQYPAALKSCLALAKFAPGFAAAVCLDSALSLSGQLESAYERLSRQIEQAQATRDERQWAYGVLAEMAERLGRIDDAENRYKSALAIDRRNVYLTSAYADFLLAQNRPGEVLELVRDQPRSDPLLLRAALAEQRTGDAGFSAHADMLGARFAAARARGDTTHQGDEAHFVLHIEHQPKRALELALSNWNVQREPRDALILLEAALAARQPESALPVLEFIRRTSLQDVRLERLVKHKQIEALRTPSKSISR